MQIAVIIPALNEEAAIGQVVEEALLHADQVIVADNGSTDQTADRARGAGAKVVCEARKGYGYACLRAMQEVGSAQIVVFMDGDNSDRAQEMDSLVAPIMTGEADLVIGSRLRGPRERGAIPLHALIANIVFAAVLRLTCGLAVTDIGPFRAIRTDRLFALNMQERTFGWTLEMMIKAAKQGLVVREVPVGYRRRIGHSKVSGSFPESLKAGVGMTQTMWRYVR